MDHPVKEHTDFITPETKVEPCTGIVLRMEFDDWAVLFDPVTGAALGINPMGITIWGLLDGTRTLKQVYKAICTSFSGVPEDGIEELKSFLQRLKVAGFVNFTSNDRESL